MNSLIRVENHLRGFHGNSGTIARERAERARTLEFVCQEMPGFISPELRPPNELCGLAYKVLG